MPTAVVLRRACRANLQGSIRLRRKDDRRDVDHLGGGPCLEQRAGDRSVRLSASWPGWPRRRAVRGGPSCAEFPRRLLQAFKAGLACRVSDRAVALLHCLVGPIDPVDPRVSRGVAGGFREDQRDCRQSRRMIYCAANWPSTSVHAGESEAACVARHRTIRPPPGATPPHSARTSPPHADRKTNNSSRGRIGRNTNAGTGAAAGVAPGLAVAAVAGAPPAAGAAPPPLAALTACSQAAETFDWFCSRHCSAGAPPVGTPAQTS